MATNTGFIDLMSFARGQELGNQQNWKDVINDINTRQAEQNMQMQQENWATELPVRQESAQQKLDVAQANREAAGWHAGVLQQANALPPEQRSNFILQEYGKRMSALDPSSPTGAAQIRAAQANLVQQGYAAMQAGDEAGAKNIFAQIGTLYNPLEAQAQQRQKQTEWYNALNERFPGMFIQNPATGQVTNIGQMLVANEQLRQLGLGAPATSAPVTDPMQEAPAATGQVVAPSVPQQAAPASPYSNVTLGGIFNPMSPQNTQLRSDIWNWLSQIGQRNQQQPLGIMPGEQVVPRAGYTWGNTGWGFR